MRCLFLAITVLGALAWAPTRPPQRVHALSIRSNIARIHVRLSLDEPGSVPASSSSHMAGEYSVYLMNDSFNMREYVARVLMMVADVSDDEASSIMMRADWEGRALVGKWERDLAQHIYDGMMKGGLAAAIHPEDDDLGDREVVAR